jgi:hypothetical protein
LKTGKRVGKGREEKEGGKRNDKGVKIGRGNRGGRGREGRE